MIDRTKEISFPFLNIEIYQSYLYPTIFHKFSNFPNSKFRSFSLFPLLSNIEKRNNNNNNDKNDWPNERNFLSPFKYRNLSYLYPSIFHEFTNFLNSIRPSLISFPFYTISRHQAGGIRMIGRTKEISFPILNIEIYESIPILLHFTNFLIFPIRSFDPSFSDFVSSFIQYREE